MLNRHWWKILFAVFGLWVVVIYSNWSESEQRIQYDEYTSIGLLRGVMSAQALYADRQPEQHYANSLYDLLTAGLIHTELATGRCGIIVIELNTSTDGQRFNVRVFPVAGQRRPNYMSFYGDQSGVIRYERGDIANADSMPLR